MLVLRRKVGESIILAGVINISVLAVEGERVKIGISAPPDVSIVREELLRAPEPKQGGQNPSSHGSMQPRPPVQSQSVVQQPH
jgi:carbon storage regulator